LKSFIFKTIKKTGQVVDVDIEGGRVLVCCCDTETSTKWSFWYPADALSKPTRSVNHPYHDLKTPKELKRESTFIWKNGKY